LAIEPVTDPKTDEVLRDKKGEIIFNKVPQSIVTEPSPKDKHTKSEIKLGIFKVLNISFKLEDKEMVVG
jgi:hypothetical protein